MIRKKCTFCTDKLVFLGFVVSAQGIQVDEDFGSTSKSTWDETYSDPIQVPVCPIMRARAKKFKDALIGMIQATWSQAITWRPNEGLACDNQTNKCMIQVLEESNQD